jgi:hypothetical protein
MDLQGYSLGVIDEVGLQELENWLKVNLSKFTLHFKLRSPMIGKS